jgi:hypothetical protein
VALAAAKASLATGTLTTAEAVLALLVGNVLGSFSRTARQNVGYWLGLFPRDLVRSLLYGTRERKFRSCSSPLWERRFLFFWRGETQ